MGVIVLVIVLAVAVVVFGVCLRLGASVTRWSVRFTNACCGGRELDERDYLRGAGYQYQPIQQPKSLAGIRIPLPGVMYAILLNFLTSLVGSLASAAVLFGGGYFLVSSLDVLAKPPEPGDPLPPEWAALVALYWLGAVPVGLLANTIVLKMALPTTFLRAAFVTFWQLVLGCVLPMAILIGVGFAVGLSNGGDFGMPKAARSGWVR